MVLCSLHSNAHSDLSVISYQLVA